jgi:hypothetical protein
MQMIEALTIHDASTIRLMDSIEVHYPMLVLIHVFFDTRPIIMPSSCGNGSLGQGAGSLRISSRLIAHI